MKGNYFFWLLSLLLFGLASPAHAQAPLMDSTTALGETSGEPPICCFDTIRFACVDSCDGVLNCYCGPNWCRYCPSKPVVAEGVVREHDFCCDGYRFGLDDTCQMPAVLYADVAAYVNRRVRVSGHRVRCGPRPLCVCRLVEGEPELASIPGPCLAVDTIEEIAACSDPDAQ